MSKISCSVNTCSYNDNGVCHSGSIKMEGVRATVLQEVHCISFTSTKKCMKSNISSECENIICNAANCLHNKDTHCACDNICISGNEAKASKQTNCCSFLCK
ncbi:MAG: DUF1540 domain-containing protein [Paraclostridium sp.]